MYKNITPDIQSTKKSFFINSAITEDKWFEFLNFLFMHSDENDTLYFLDTLKHFQNDNYLLSSSSEKIFISYYLLLKEHLKDETFNFDIFNRFLNPESMMKVLKNLKLKQSNRIVLIDELQPIEGFSFVEPTLDPSFVIQLSIITQKIRKTFVDTSNLIIDREFLNICNSFISKYQTETSDERVHILGNIVYKAKMTHQNKLEFIDAIELYKKPEFLPLSHFSFSSMISALSNKKEKDFFMHMNILIDNYKRENLIEYLSREDKIKIFFGAYIKQFSQTYESLIQALLMNYNEKIFNSLFEQLQLPINCPMKFEKDEIKIEEKDGKTVRRLVKSVSYHNALEYCLDNGLEHIALKIYKKYKNESVYSFQAKIVENDCIYHYQYQFLSHDYTAKKENHLLFLIKHNLITPDDKVFYINSKDEITHDNIFFYLLFQEYYDAFIELFSKYLKNISQGDILHPLKNENNHTLFLFFIRNIAVKLSQKKKLKDFYQFAQYISEISPSLFNTKPSSEKLREYLSAIFSLDKNFAIYIIEQFRNHLPAEWSHYETEKFSLSSEDITENYVKKITWFNREKLESHLEKLAGKKESSNVSTINQMLKQDNHLRDNLIIKDESIFEKLENEFPNFKDVINFYKGQFRIKSLNNKISVQPVLLLGPPGIGKTYFAKKLAQHLNTGYTFLDLGGMSSKWILSGANGTWKDAKQGKVLDAILQSNTINPVIVMDEIDKSRGGEHDPTIVLYQLLEEINSKSFTDEFIDFPFDASGIIYIACANNIHSLSEPLVSRFKIFEISLPQDEQFEKIVNNIYYDSIKDSEIFSAVLNKEFLEIFKGKSMRTIKTIIQEAINKAILELSLDEITKKKHEKDLIDLKAQHFTELYKKKEIGF